MLITVDYVIHHLATKLWTIVLSVGCLAGQSVGQLDILLAHSIFNAPDWEMQLYELWKRFTVEFMVLKSVCFFW